MKPPNKRCPSCGFVFDLNTSTMASYCPECGNPLFDDTTVPISETDKADHNGEQGLLAHGILDHKEDVKEAQKAAGDSTVASETAHENNLANETNTNEATKVMSQTAERQQAPLEVYFFWNTDGKLGAKLVDTATGTCTTYPTGFIKPANESVADFCSRVAAMLENEYSRPVRYHRPVNKRRSYAAKADKGASGLRRIALPIACCAASVAIVSLLGWFGQYRLFSHASSGSRVNTNTYSSSSGSPGISSNSRNPGTSSKRTASSVSEYLNSYELTLIRLSVSRACDDLMSLLASRNVTEINARIDDVTSCLETFRQLDAPSECMGLRDDYIQAANNTVSGLKCMREAIAAKGDNSAQIEKATEYFNLVSVSLNNVTSEVNRLK